MGQIQKPTTGQGRSRSLGIPSPKPMSSSNRSPQGSGNPAEEEAGRHLTSNLGNISLHQTETITEECNQSTCRVVNLSPNCETLQPLSTLRLRDDGRRVGRNTVRVRRSGSFLWDRLLRTLEATPIYTHKVSPTWWPTQELNKDDPTRKRQHLWLLLREGQEASTPHKGLQASKECWDWKQ